MPEPRVEHGPDVGGGGGPGTPPGGGGAAPERQFGRVVPGVFPKLPWIGWQLQDPYSPPSLAGSQMVTGGHTLPGFPAK